MLNLRICLIILISFYRSYGATHWIVTEKGMINSLIGSPLDLRRPYDLISLLDQEKRWGEIQTVLQDLMSRQSVIEEKWGYLQGNSGLESKVVSIKNSDCLMNVEMLNTADLYSIATNGSERVDLHFKVETEDTTIFRIPDCSKYSKVDFSFPEYEHLPSLHSDEIINLAPDGALEKIMPTPSIQLFGHEIQKELEKNSTSWVHYNLAALFWRIKGDGSKAVECSKRALFYAPILYRDIPLHNLAGIVHKSGRSKEALAMLHTAIQYASTPNLHYLALGNIYFALGDYNKSISYLDKFVEIEPKHTDISALKEAGLCFSKLETHLIDIQENVLGYLQGVLSDLHDFHSLQQHWLRLSKRVMWEHSSYDEELGNFYEDALENLFGKQNQRCVKKSSTISCDLAEPVAELDTMNLQNLFQYVETETQKINENLAKVHQMSMVEQRHVDKPLTNTPLLHQKFPTSMSTSGEKYFDASGWPLEDECLKWNLPLTEKNDLKIPIFLPPENKGFDIHQILTDGIGLPDNLEHKLPWYPPVCEEANGSGEKYVQQSERILLNNEIKSNQFLRNHFVKYVGNGKADEAEIGQRIITAMEKKAAPNWVLASLASLYWRIRGNPRKALDCLDLALKAAPKDQTDVVLVSISSIVHQLGLPSQALKYANLAFKLNYVEPSTNFILALLHYESNPLMAMYYMKNVLRVDSEYYDGQAERLLKIWSCRIKLGTYNNIKKNGEKGSQETCSEKEAFKGQGIICASSGDDCKAASVQCYQTKNSEDPAVLKRSIIRLKHSPKPFSIYSEGSGDTEPDQSQLERVNDGLQPFHMKILLSADQMSPSRIPEFYVAFSEDAGSETILHVYDKSGTYPLSAHACKDIVEADWVHFTSIWQSFAARQMDSNLKPIPKNSKRNNEKPYCAEATHGSSKTIFNHLTNKIIHMKFVLSPDLWLSEWLSVMAGDQTASVEEIGAKISYALRENSTSWLLATAASLYWRVIGNAEEAIVCLKSAFNSAPENMKDIPLINLAHILQKFGFKSDALEIAYLALKSNSNAAVNHFTVGTILTLMGDLEEAISFYRSALALDSSFEPARNRLQAILCALLFDESGSVRSIPEN